MGRRRNGEICANPDCEHFTLDFSEREKVCYRCVRCMVNEDYYTPKECPFEIGEKVILSIGNDAKSEYIVKGYNRTIDRAVIGDEYTDNDFSVRIESLEKVEKDKTKTKGDL